MKTLVTLVLTLVTVLMAAQSTSNLIIFSEDGSKFYLILNGIRQNDLPQTNVKVIDLNQPYYSATIIFEDKKKPSITTKDLFVVDPISKAQMEVTYRIKKNSKSKYIMRFYSEVPIEQAAPSHPQIVEYHYNNVPMPPIGTVILPSNNGKNTNVSVGASGMGVNFGLNVNINEPSQNQPINSMPDPIERDRRYDSPISNSCDFGYAMAPKNFEAAKATIAKQSFDDTRLTVANQIINSNCLKASQIKELMLLFKFEENRLKFAKQAHVSCVDKKNYFLLNDAFTFESSIEELTNSIR